MDNASVYTLLHEAQKLSTRQRMQLIELLAATMQQDLPEALDWHAALRATYGILTHDPIERPAQPDLEEREPLE